MVRAAVEGVCQQLTFIRDALLAADVVVRVAGSTTRSEVWCDALAA